MHMDAVPGAGLACGWTITDLGGQVAGSRGAEQDGGSECGEGVGEGDEAKFGGLGKPRCRFHHGLLFMPRSPGIEFALG
jgi:hypothetical protein